jgi:pyruvyltransferase
LVADVKPGAGSKSIRLYYYRRKNGLLNFGDELSPLLLRYVTGFDVVRAGYLDADVLGLGSILNKSMRLKYKAIFELRRSVFRRRKPIVWGAGLIKAFPHKKLDFLDFRAVRGTLTSDTLSCGEVPLGDPGLLVSEYFQEREKKHFVGIVPHFLDKDAPELTELLEGVPHAKLISVEDDPVKILRDISECEVVLSSSLHGLIVADAFGMPNFRLKLGDRLKGGDFKFNDYCTAIHRPDISPISMEKAFSLESGEWGDFGYQANIAGICEDLKQAFPRELFV